MLSKGHFHSRKISTDTKFSENVISRIHIRDGKLVLGADYMDRASPVDRAEKCHENLPWAAKLVLNRV